MRLICPNCDAQYEVDDGAIPDEGRDVQCSNCGHAWFQIAPEEEAARTAEEELFGTAEFPAPAVTAALAAPPPPPPVVAEPDPEPPAPAAAPRRALDESLLAVLREEAEREVAVRRAEDPRPVETQADLGLAEPEPDTAASVARRRIAQMKGVDPDILPPAAARPATRRDLLPDIEEINSTLRASNERRRDGDSLPPEPQPGRGGFRSGFVLMMIVAVVLSLTYAMAPRISAQLPASAPTLDGYVAAVDAARLWLDGVMQQATGTVRGLSGSEG
ncbi:zinc-ribbon domain-containing protein [Paracoccaceae bacterium Fryx2]|nr:zinc-ribbon domain-containing protein [Paracoccaceae bacterium Fryx2]